MNRHALEVLEYPTALAVVAAHASSSLGAEAVRGLEPSDAHAWVEPELRRVEEVASFLRANDAWAPPAIPDLRASLRRLATQGTVWEAPVLRDAGVLLRSARLVRRAVLPAAEEYPLLAELARRLAALDAEEEAIRRAVDDAGEVRDDASRELAGLRRELRGARARIVKRLEQFMASLPERFRVADASVSVREGRYVIPVRREGRAEVGGLVHDESATGATLFVEPPFAIELMNRLRSLERAESREVLRILRELTERLRPHRDALVATLDALVELDSRFARARYALSCGGHRPVVVRGANRGYGVVRGFHPLLLAADGEVVPFDLELGPDERTLLVSGPNTGGKTVLLKAIGLISALTQSGVIPPVGAGTRLPLFRDVFADIGDEQSIEASLSTFSAHLKNLREILEQAGGEALVLIDEIGSGTDPAEGGALATAILTELTRRGALTVATSHLGQLKLLAGEEPGIVNASLQFDSRELRPTYRLKKGVPGRSYGLAIARRLGFPEPVLERAEGTLPQAERDVSQLLLELEEKEQRMAEALREVEAARRESARLRAELDAREREVRQRERDAERRARQQARDLLLGSRAEVEAAILELREAVERGLTEAELKERARQARRRVEAAAKRQADRTPAAGPAGPSARSVGSGSRAAPSAGGAQTGSGEAAGMNGLPWPEAGRRVRVAATGGVGTVLEVRDGRAIVETGGVRLQVPVAELTPLGAAEEPKPPAAGAAAGTGWTAPEPDARPEIDLRGLRAEEVSGRLDPALDAASRAELGTLRVIHGKGTGALREVVADLLEGDPRVSSFRPGGPGEGGSGVTVVELA